MIIVSLPPTLHYFITAFHRFSTGIHYVFWLGGDQRSPFLVSVLFIFTNTTMNTSVIYQPLRPITSLGNLRNDRTDSSNVTVDHYRSDSDSRYNRWCEMYDHN